MIIPAYLRKKRITKITMSVAINQPNAVVFPVPPRIGNG
jgi:hypothetical protein